MLDRLSTLSTPAVPDGAPRRPTQPVAGGEAERTVPGWPEDRTYVVHVPPGWDPEKPMPAVVAIHGYTHDAEKMRRLTSPDGDPKSPRSLEGLADREGFVVIYPNGTSLGPVGGRAWNGGGGVSGYAAIASPVVERGVDDVKYLRDLLDDVSKVIRLDGNRIYAAGISNGGAMAHRLAMEMADRFAAVAAVAAANQFAEASRAPEPDRNVPVMVIHGVQDPIWPYEGSQVPVARMASVPRSAERWAEWNEAGPGRTELLPDVDPGDGTRVRRTTYEGDADVVLYTVEGGGHAWPSGHQFAPEHRIGKVSRDLDANEAIWEFFESHPRR